jgi:iron complex outermembrane receptor protein
VRYAKNDQSFTQTSTGLLLGIPPGETFSLPTRESSDDALTYLANARYHFTENATGYVRFATGYRPGGPNVVANDPATGEPVAPATFQPDKLSSYEVGIKALSDDRRFSVDAAAYYIDWNDIHILAFVNGIGITANAPGGATVKGAELAVTAATQGGLTVTGAFAYQDATMSEADANLGAAKGDRVPNVPHFTAAANIDYVRPGRRGLNPSVGATVRYVSSRWASFDESPSIPQYSLPSYEVLDVRTGLTIGVVDLQLFVHNVLNERGQLSADTSRGPAQVSLLQPRTIGISATVPILTNGR